MKEGAGGLAHDGERILRAKLEDESMKVAKTMNLRFWKISL